MFLFPAGEGEFVGAGLEVAGGCAGLDEVGPAVLAGLRGGVYAGDTHDECCLVLIDSVVVRMVADERRRQVWSDSR